MRSLMFLILTLVTALVVAETPAEKGLAIAIEADKRDTGWVDFKAKMKMTLRNKQGQESTRTIKLSSQEVLNDGDKSLSIFSSPRDIKGTAFLSYTHAL
ncbi:MAG: outer membrane lipoprotein-sorting protein, partial [Proteobacteria bacterium]|nr:outer membrane lipoprotein-sorting protein [Pseudomonadota bacterium]